VGFLNDSTWCLALVYWSTCRSMLYFQWLRWIVMELELGTWAYLWVHLGTYECGWGLWSPCGLVMIVHGAWHWYMEVCGGLCCIFRGCCGWSWRLWYVGVLVRTCGYK
jgi:hypothetical protein